MHKLCAVISQILRYAGILCVLAFLCRFLQYVNYFPFQIVPEWEWISNANHSILSCPSSVLALFIANLWCSCTLFVTWLKVFQNLDIFAAKDASIRFTVPYSYSCANLSLITLLKSFRNARVGHFLFVKKRLKVIICGLSLPFSSQLENLAGAFMYFSCFTLWIVGRVRRSLTRCVRSWLNWVCVLRPLRICPELLCVGWVDFYPRMDGYSSKLLE